MTNIQKKSLISVVAIFLGTLLILTIGRSIAGNNPYIYAAISACWFILVFIREVSTKKKVLSKEWQIFKEKKWFNVICILLTIVALLVVLQITRPFFNSFVPEKELKTYPVPINTTIGLIITVLIGLINLLIAFVEEITYRYEGMYVFKSNKVMLVVMLFISSVLFGFSHYYNFGGSFIATGPYIAAGLVIGISYLITKTIWVPLIVHILFNSKDIISAFLLVYITQIHK